MSRSFTEFTENTVGPQSTSNPCIIAATTCQQPAGMPYTNYISSGAISSYSENSPTYTVGQLESFVGTAFNIAIDVNITQAASEQLLTVEVFINNVLQFVYNGPVTIGGVNANGNGYADWLLKTVNLSGFASGASILFPCGMGQRRRRR